MKPLITRQPLLTDFQEAGVLGLADVHTALGVCRLAEEPRQQVLLALALAVAAVRRGSVCLELSHLRETAVDVDGVDADLAANLVWPESDELITVLQSSPLVIGHPGSPLRPLVLVNSDAGFLLYLTRYFRQEQIVRNSLERRAASRPVIDSISARAALNDMFVDNHGNPTPAPDRQRVAAAMAATEWTTTVAGGPGTGKTHTAARILGLLYRLHGPELRVALCAPTGKAAGALTEAVATQGSHLGLPDGLSAKTLHRLLGMRRFGGRNSRYCAANRLPYDVVVVDETSMVSVTLMAQLLEALRDDTRLILIGDPDQLTSVDAGAVLDDLVHRPHLGTVSEGLVALVDLDLDAPPSSREPALDDEERTLLSAGVVRLARGHRFNASIAQLAEAIRHGKVDEVLTLLNDPAEQAVTLCSPADFEAIRADIASSGTDSITAAERGNVDAALAALLSHRLLCAHREGPFGRRYWDDLVRTWIETAIGRSLNPDRFYPGQPLLITANDYEAGVFNGDIGVVIAGKGGVLAAIERGRDPLLIQPDILSSVQTAYAMTVHRSQGSQYQAVSVVLPEESSPLLTRQLLYTAVTRARNRVRIVGSEASVAVAVSRQAQRASGLRRTFCDD